MNPAITIRRRAPPTAIPTIAPVDKREWLVSGGALDGVGVGVGVVGSIPIARKVALEVAFELRAADARSEDGHDP